MLHKLFIIVKYWRFSAQKLCCKTYFALPLHRFFMVLVFKVNKKESRRCETTAYFLDLF